MSDALDRARAAFADATIPGEFGTKHAVVSLALAQTAALISIAETLERLSVVEFDERRTS